MTQPQHRTVDQDDILNLILVATERGHSSIVRTLVHWAMPITADDIERFARGYLTPEARAEGYDEADHDAALEILTEAVGQYGE